MYLSFHQTYFVKIIIKRKKTQHISYSYSNETNIQSKFETR